MDRVSPFFTSLFTVRPSVRIFSSFFAKDSLETHFTIGLVVVLKLLDNLSCVSRIQHDQQRSNAVTT